MSAPVPLPAAPRLIAGLGNPGREYADTRHNIGFMVVEALASQLLDASHMVRRKVRAKSDQHGTFRGFKRQRVALGLAFSTY